MHKFIIKALADELHQTQRERAASASAKPYLCVKVNSLGDGIVLKKKEYIASNIWLRTDHIVVNIAWSIGSTSTDWTSVRISLDDPTLMNIIHSLVDSIT
jgi:hypothetical protein